MNRITNASRSLIAALDHTWVTWREETLKRKEGGDGVNAAWDELIAALKEKEDWKTIDMDLDFGKRSYVPISVSAVCPACGENNVIDEVPLEYATEGENEFEIWCFNEDCDNYDREIIGTATIELSITVEARVTGE